MDEPGKLPRSTVADWLAVAAAVVACLIALYAYFAQREANQKADRANDLAAAANSSAAAANSLAAKANSIAEEGLGLGKQAEGRATRQKAEGVSMGEPPAAAAVKHPLPPGVPIWYAVYNATNTPIENVWVKDGKGGTITISGIEPCTLYALDPGFKPSDLYFSDSDGRYWHRAYNSQPEQLTADRFPPMPEQDTGSSPWLAPVENCSGG